MKQYVETHQHKWALSLWWRLANMGATQVLDTPSIKSGLGLGVEQWGQNY